MSVEFTVSVSGPESLYSVKLSRGLLTDLAGAVEATGIERLLLTDADGTRDVAAHASYLLHATVMLGIDIEHRAGVVAPEIAARQLATLDQLSGGRLGAQIVPQNADGPSHEEDLARLDEYLVLLKRLWSNDTAIDHEGRFFRISAGLCTTKPFHGGSVPLALGGVSGTALKVAARHADRFILKAESVGEARQIIERVRVAAASYGRVNRIRFSLPVRLARTSAERADASTSFPGSPEKTALTLLDYCRIGVTDFVVSGLATPSEVAAFGERVVALVRRVLLHREDYLADHVRHRSGNVVRGRWSGRG